MFLIYSTLPINYYYSGSKDQSKKQCAIQEIILKQNLFCNCICYVKRSCTQLELVASLTNLPSCKGVYKKKSQSLWDKLCLKLTHLDILASRYLSFQSHITWLHVNQSDVSRQKMVHALVNVNKKEKENPEGNPRLTGYAKCNKSALTFCNWTPLLHMLCCNFILGANFIFLCLGVW